MVRFRPEIDCYRSFSCDIIAAMENEKKNLIIFYCFSSNMAAMSLSFDSPGIDYKQSTQQ